MKKVKSLISITLSIILVLFISGCKNKDDKETYKELYGIAIYQKTSENKNWSTYSKKTSKLSNLITTTNGEIVYNEDPGFLFYTYSKSEITADLSTNEFLSNTTINSPTISDNTLIFEMEKIKECSQILICCVYKNKDNFTLEFIQKENAIPDANETIELEINNPYFSKIKLNLLINITIKNEY